jgi:DNA-binding CsgD family transcriptional regulator
VTTGRPTRRQLEVLRTYIAAGSVKAAAVDLEIRETTVRQHLSGLYRRTGCLNAAQAVYWLGRSEQQSKLARPLLGIRGSLPRGGRGYDFCNEAVADHL